MSFDDDQEDEDFLSWDDDAPPIAQRRKAETWFTLPDRCWSCNALLMGGATEHTRECEIRKMIVETFGEENYERIRGK